MSSSLERHLSGKRELLRGRVKEEKKCSERLLGQILSGGFGSWCGFCFVSVCDGSVGGLTKPSSCFC